MEIECEHHWRNEEYEKLFDELKEKSEALGMPIPKRDLKRLPPEWESGKITLDPLQVMPFYRSTDNPGWTVGCIFGDWFTLDIEYDQFKNLVAEAEKEYDVELSSDEETKTSELESRSGAEEQLPGVV